MSISEGKCYQDRRGIDIFLDNSPGMFKKYHDVNPLSIAITFLKALLSKIDRFPEMRDHIRVYIGRKSIITNNFSLRDQFFRTFCWIKEEKQLPYSILCRKHRAKPFTAAKIIVLTHKRMSAPAILKEKTVVLDFDLRCNDEYNCNENKYNHVNYTETASVVSKVFATFILPNMKTALTGTHTTIGTLYGRLNKDPFLMTIPVIHMFGVNNVQKFKHLEPVGRGVYVTTPNTITPDMYVHYKMELYPDLVRGKSIEQLSDNLTDVKEMVAGLARGSNGKSWYLLGYSQDSVTLEKYTVVFSRATESNNTVSPFSGMDWIKSQDMLSEWDSCTSNVHGGLELDAAKTTPCANANNRQNWLFGSDSIRMTFYKYNDWDEILWGEDFAHPGERQYESYDFEGISYSTVMFMAYNRVAMKHVLLFCYDCFKNDKTFTFFDRAEYLDYEAEFRKNIIILCEEVVREQKSATDTEIDVHNRGLEFYKVVSKKVVS